MFLKHVAGPNGELTHTRHRLKKLLMLSMQWVEEDTNAGRVASLLVESYLMSFAEKGLGLLTRQQGRRVRKAAVKHFFTKPPFNFWAKRECYANAAFILLLLNMPCTLLKPHWASSLT